ncbi:MAG: citrate synthase [Clostridia bacterium]|nr:citrate synthase [Clostridia bacterium]
MSIIESKVSESELSLYKDQILNNNYINPDSYNNYNVKRGLRNADGTGVMAGMTRVCSVEGYYMIDGERVPMDGHLTYRGINVEDIVKACETENRFGFEEVVFLLLLGKLPSIKELDNFKSILSACRELPDDFIEDMIMKAPSRDIMNKMARSVLALYSYDENPDSTSLENVIRQSVHIIAQLPPIMAYAYQVKRRQFYHKSMYIHQLKPEFTTAQTILRSIRGDKTFTDEEAKLLDLCLILQAEHGGGNNSAFATRVLSSSGTDTYSAIAAGIGALKGPKHGGANKKVSEMLDYFKENVSDLTDEAMIRDYIAKIIKKEAGDGSGLIYGMGHAVYTLSDPRAKILKRKAAEFAPGTEYEDEFRLINLIEKNTPEIFAEIKGSDKPVCANVDLYSGLIYKILRVPEDLFTPIFTCARISGWSAHRIEEILTGGRIIRPAYKNVNTKTSYVPISDR